MNVSHSVLAIVEHEPIISYELCTVHCSLSNPCLQDYSVLPCSKGAPRDRGERSTVYLRI